MKHDTSDRSHLYSEPIQFTSQYSVHATTRNSDEQHALKSANNVTWTLYISQVNI